MDSVRNEIRFVLNDKVVRLNDVRPTDTLLNFLRLEKRLCGTKEGCAEGDCGACTLLIAKRRGDGGLVYETVTSCIRLLASVDLAHVVTIEHLRDPDGGLHVVQQAMVDHHGSQCGFCTPGIVMSLYALWLNNPEPTRDAVETSLQGNLCRCTGYRPIVDAALAAALNKEQVRDVLNTERDKVLSLLETLDDGAHVEVMAGSELSILPRDVEDLAQVFERKPHATLVAGSTDVGLWVTKFMREISSVIFIGHLKELQKIDKTDSALILGAGVTYSDCEEIIGAEFPHLAEFWQRIGGWQVRNMGTVGGNIANGSPIGDTPPALIALGASIVLRKGDHRRKILLEDFYIAYGKQDIGEGEFLEAVEVPLRELGAFHGVYKISKRRDEDISSVCGAFTVLVEAGVVTSACIAFGGMAATPKRAHHMEAALVGKAWSEDTILQAMETISQDFTPLSDWRASARYRSRVARNLLHRFYLENETTEHSASLKQVGAI